ncbi:MULTISPECIES: SulP family inorganic anion transporter [unclassified Enterobacter]|uniref:SulP family inorganic anion transporter n=1 Tax=unclassified Enterobacter TaxID=2608935 RepID=UPI00093313DE|nr:MULTISPECIES: SulP family inorganic anion transporter [unclassified Enterobacter]WJD49141.1 SulP family inorganic anion transporter [Enterobacter sp. PGRG2]
MPDPMSSVTASHDGRVSTVLRSPSLLMRETLAGVITALALIPEVISFSVIAGVDPKVSLIASVVLCLSMSLLGGRPAMVTAAAGSVALVIGPMVHQHGVEYILPAVLLAGLIQILFGLAGMARLMRFIPHSVMTGFVNALGILIFFAQVPHFWSREPLILGLFGLTLLIVLWLPRWVKSIPSPLVAIVLLTLFTVTSGQILPTVGDEGPMQGGLPGFTQWLVPFNLHTLSIIWPCALSIAFVGLMESLLTAKLVDDLTDTRSSKRRESAGLGIANILAGLYGGIAGCAMIGQTIVNVEMGKGRSRISTVAAGLVLLLLVTALSEVMAKIPMAVLAGIMVIVAVKTFSWHSIRPAELKQAPVAETLVMLVTVAATVSTGNLAIGVAAGVALMFVLPGRRQRAADAKAKTASPDPEK